MDKLTPERASAENSGAVMQLAPARLDVRTYKTQLAIGTVSAVLAAICINAALLDNAYVQPANLSLIALCTVLVTQVVSELLARLPNRLNAAPMVWAALLFALSPFHPISVGDIESPRQLLCAALILLSLFAHLRSGNTKSSTLLQISLLAALAAMLTSPEALILPVVISGIELIVPGSKSTQRFIPVLLFWMTLFFAETISSLAPDMVLLPPNPNVDLLKSINSNHTLKFIGAAVLAPLVALPPIALSKRAGKIVFIVGSLLLTGLAYYWLHYSLTFVHQLERRQVHPHFVWPAPAAQSLSPESGPLYSFAVNDQTLSKMHFEPASAIRQPGAAFNNEQISVTPLKDTVRFYIGDKPLRIWLPEKDIDTTTASVAAIKLLYTSATGCHTCQQDSLRLIWKDAISNQVQSATISNINFGQYLVWLGRYPEWTAQKTVKQIGFEFLPGKYYVDVSNIDLLPYFRTSPLVVLEPKDMRIKFSVESIPQAAGIKLVVIPQGIAGRAKSEHDLYALLPSSVTDTTLVQADIQQVAGLLPLPEQISANPGKYELRTIALNAEQQELGLPSVPIEFEVPKK